LSFTSSAVRSPDVISPDIGGIVSLTAKYVPRRHGVGEGAGVAVGVTVAVGVMLGTGRMS